MHERRSAEFEEQSVAAGNNTKTNTHERRTWITKAVGGTRSAHSVTINAMGAHPGTNGEAERRGANWGGRGGRRSLHPDSYNHPFKLKPKLR